MLYSYYYVTLPYNYVYDTDESGITSFLKKYNFDILLPMPIPKTINKSTYLICIPLNRSSGFLDLFEEEYCRYTFLKTEDINITDIEQKYVNEISLWNGCYYETEYFISSKSNADN